MATKWSSSAVTAGRSLAALAGPIPRRLSAGRSSDWSDPWPPAIVPKSSWSAVTVGRFSTGAKAETRLAAPGGAGEHPENDRREHQPDAEREDPPAHPRPCSRRRQGNRREHDEDRPG